MLQRGAAVVVTLKIDGRLVQARLVLAQRGRDASLEWRRRREGKVRVGRAERAHQRRRPIGPRDAPPSQREELAAAGVADFVANLKNLSLTLLLLLLRQKQAVAKFLSRCLPTLLSEN